MWKICTYLNKIVKIICHNLKCNEYNTIKITIFKICVICYTKNLTEIHIYYDEHQFFIWSLNLILYIYLLISHTFKNISNSPKTPI